MTDDGEHIPRDHLQRFLSDLGRLCARYSVELEGDRETGAMRLKPITPEQGGYVAERVDDGPRVLSSYDSGVRWDDPTDDIVGDDCHTEALAERAHRWREENSDAYKEQAAWHDRSLAIWDALPEDSSPQQRVDWIKAWGSDWTPLTDDEIAALRAAGIRCPLYVTVEEQAELNRQAREGAERREKFEEEHGRLEEFMNRDDVEPIWQALPGWTASSRALWFVEPNEGLDWQRPIDRLDDMPAVLEAARNAR